MAPFYILNTMLLFKTTMEKRVYAMNIQNKFNKLSKRLKEKGINKKRSLSTANKILNKHIGKPLIIRKINHPETK